MKPKAIIFDFFGVFCAEVAKHWYEAHAIEEPYETLRARIIFPYDLGTERAHDAYEELGKAGGTTGEAVQVEWLSRAKINADMVALVRELSGQYTTALCTNANAEFLKEIISRNGLDTLFGTVVISSDEGVLKPDPEMYRITLARMNCTPRETLFIDDRPENVAAAETLGMKGIVFSDAATLRQELAELGVL